MAIPETKERPIHVLAQELASGGCTAVELVSSYLSRIDAEDGVIKAFLKLDRERVLRAAEESDRRRAAGKTLSVYDGIPIGIKDCIVAEGETCSCASKILEPVVSPYDSTAVARLRAQGFIPFGRLNMDEFAMGSSCENSAFQKTANPRDPQRVPGGSSGGSAACVAASFAAGALGSDTGGSIRQPAAFCGIVGLKPTYGRVSRSGLVAFASSLDQIGPMTHDVEDAGILLDAIAGHDPMDATSLPDSAGGFAEASANLARFDGMRYGKRVDGKDLVDTYFKSRGEGFGDEVKRRILLGTYVLSSGYYDAYYLRAQKVRTLIRRDFEQAFKQCDVLLTPVTPTVAFKFGEKSDPLQMYLSDIFTIALNLSGNCGISLPAGLDAESGMPVGVQLLAPAMGEAKLLGAAQTLMR